MPDLEGSLSKVMIGAFTVESIDGHNRGLRAASLTTFSFISSCRVFLPKWLYGIMSTPSLNAEKVMFPTVLLYCRRTLEHLNSPRGNLILSPRMSHSTFTGLSYIVLYCLQRILFSHQTEQPLTWARCNWFHHLFRHAPIVVYIFKCKHHMACLLSSASTAHYVSLYSPFVMKCILGTVCFFFC